ncbi:MAG: glycosyltransferase family 39 protein [Candidatus Omnitrophota bacterium]|nr:glycosyltransferase family 39 protein [Candidatus Omnitrophota bacterium]
MKNNKYIKHIIILAILSYFCFMFGNGLLSLTIPDEVFYTQTAKEMAQQHSWMTPYLFGQPQFEKPILLYWLLRLGFMIFGITSFAARFFPALFGAIGVIAVYLLARLGFKDEDKAFISAIVLMTSGLYIGLARTVFTDLIFSVFILLSLLSFYWGYSLVNRKSLGIKLFFVFAALATLTKGPLGLFIPFLSAVSFLFIKKDLKFLVNRYWLWGLLLFVVIALPWYLLMFKLYGNTFIQEFFYNDHFRRIVEAEHIGNDTWYFYPFSMVGCIFPWSIFLAVSLFFLPKYLKQKDNHLHVFLTCLIAVVFIIFQSAHSKLVSYIFPLFPALALLTGNFIIDLITQEKKRLIYSILSFNLFIVFLVPLAFVIASFWFKDYLSPYISSQAVINFFIFVFLVFGLSMFFLIKRGKILKSIYCLALFVPIMIYFTPFVKSDIEPYLSTKASCEYLLKNYKFDNIILTSKFFVRGIRYYTDKETAVIDIPGTPFFSPHPVLFLNSDVKVGDFLRKQKVTYCVLKKSSVEDIQRINLDVFKYTVLKVIGNEYILKIETL